MATGAVDTTVAASPDEVWKKVGNFGGAGELFPAIESFRLEGDDDRNRALLELVNASGEMFISHAVLGGRYVLRLAIGQVSTTEEDVRRAWDVLVREASRV